MPTASNSSPEQPPLHLEVTPHYSPDSPRPSKRRVILLLAAGVVLAGCAVYLFAKRPSQGPAVVAGHAYVPTTVVRTGTVERTLRVVAQTSAIRYASIIVRRQRGQMAGHGRMNLTLTKLAAAGSMVHAGDEVAQLDTEDIRVQIDDLQDSIDQVQLDIERLKAQLTLDWLRLEQTVRSEKAGLDRATLDFKAAEVKTPIEQELLKLSVDEADASYKQMELSLPLKKVSQQASLRSAELRLQRLQNRYEMLVNDLKNYTFSAPLDGLVVLQTFERPGGSSAQYQVGDSVNPGRAFMKIVDPASMQLEARASQSEAGQIRVGQTATVTLDAYPGLKFQGKVYSLGALARPGARENYFVRTVPVSIRVTGSDPRLIPDLSAAGDILLDRQENATVVPLEAVQSQGGRFFAFLKRLNGFEARDVELGLRSATHAAILSGLTAGDEVALATPVAAVN